MISRRQPLAYLLVAPYSLFAFIPATCGLVPCWFLILLCCALSFPGICPFSQRVALPSPGFRHCLWVATSPPSILVVYKPRTW